MLNLKRYSTAQPDFDIRLKALLAFEGAQDESVDATVAAILREVKTRGDEAVLEYTRRFDRLEAASMAALELPKARLAQAFDNLPAAERQALEQAAARVRAYHERQLLQSWSYTEPDGTLLGQQVTALDRVGLYVPGGKAAYPSSVLRSEEHTSELPVT